MVRASEGKRARAEPVALLAERGHVHHVGALPVLEDQITTWSPADRDSPDRLDALVYAVLADLVTYQVADTVPKVKPVEGSKQWEHEQEEREVAAFERKEQMRRLQARLGFRR
jgi:hypothetical protein